MNLALFSWRLSNGRWELEAALGQVPEEEHYLE